MQVGRTAGRGERGRVARRVRAVLADAADNHVGAGQAGADVPPWLPGDDFAPTPPAPREPRPAPPSEPGSEPAVRHSAGWLARLTPRLPVRLDPGWRGALVIGIAVLVAAVVTGGWVLAARPRAVGVTDTPRRPTALDSASSAAASAGPPHPAAPPVSASSAPVMLVVDVAGKVRHPGLYRLPAGSRVDDAVQAAGGVLRGVDLTTVNLAAKLTDGQQIAVGMPGAAPAPASGGPGSAGATATAVVDLNTATLDQLQTLPGVGPVLAQHIADWRVAHGRFTTVDQLRDVSGIGDVKFAALRGLVSV